MKNYTHQLKKSYLTLVFILGCLLLHTDLHAIPKEVLLTKAQQLEESLIEYWGVDKYTAGYIRNKMTPILENTEYHSIIDDFVEKSKNLHIDFSSIKKIPVIHPEDGIYKSPEQHVVLFENPYVRIFLSSTKPGVREPFHMHAWKSLMVIIKPTTYEIETMDGLVTTGYWPTGVYELPPEEYYACTNIGNNEDECLRFEVKN
ncbi:MAG: hypothetical protein H0W88_09520 [Parachlamydiaceae bacterium]|nr:hypothetical protein [Parachlamydiaceae bacterium]